MQGGPRKQGPDAWRFAVWAPKARTVELETLDPEPGRAPMALGDRGWWILDASGLAPGCRYWFVLDGEKRRADPCSHSQPQGVHGPSALVDHQAFAWTCPDFRPPPLDQWILYELHVGTFTPQGTLDAAAGRLDHLADLGVTAVELMPLAPFPGERNWGYDGVFPYAVHAAHGGPEGLKRFTDACHRAGLAVVLDVVYNHLGPEGNHLRDFGPYFSDRVRTPWGEAINFDGPGSDEVRQYVVQNALHWFERHRIDGLRLDAVHAMHDARPRHILQELALATRDFGERAGRRPLLLAEPQANDPRLAEPLEKGGMGMDGFWSDDFHHAAHALLTGERQGCYQDYGTVEHLERAMARGFAYDGRFSAFRGRTHGLPAAHLPPQAFVQSVQTHDQVGNRPGGERLASLAGFEACKLAAALLLLAPGTPMLFMGEEWAETAPFLYFTSHTDPGLAQAVRRGRKREFKSFRWKGAWSDPQAEETFERSKLDWAKLDRAPHRLMFQFYKKLIRLRRASAPLREQTRQGLRVWSLPDSPVLQVLRRAGSESALCLFNLSSEEQSVDVAASLGAGTWTKVLDSADAAWSGPGALLPPEPGDASPIPPFSAAVYAGRLAWRPLTTCQKMIT